MKALRIVAPGPFTTVQDRGFIGYRGFGIPPCGMLDSWAGVIANHLVGNDKGDAVLEWTYLGGHMEALDNFDLAVTGGDMELRINGISRQSWMTHSVRTGDNIELGKVRSGCRTYLSVTGGIDTVPIMGSRSTYIAAKIGGYDGRTLAKGDILSRGQRQPLARQRTIPEKWIPVYSKDVVLRTVSGPQENYFGKGKGLFFSEEFEVTSNANRMGYRLLGKSIQCKRNKPRSIISEPVLPGAVQIPEDGQPIVLLVEQTVGGYAKIATIISTDIPKLAQVIPGAKIKFEAISLDEAHQIYRDQEKLLRMLTADNKGGIICPDTEKNKN